MLYNITIICQDNLKIYVHNYITFGLCDTCSNMCLLRHVNAFGSDCYHRRLINIVNLDKLNLLKSESCLRNDHTRLQL